MIEQWQKRTSLAIFSLLYSGFTKQTCVKIEVHNSQKLPMEPRMDGNGGNGIPRTRTSGQPWVVAPSATSYPATCARTARSLLLAPMIPNYVYIDGQKDEPRGCEKTQPRAGIFDHPLYLPVGRPIGHRVARCLGRNPPPSPRRKSPIGKSPNPPARWRWVL